jgi:ATP-binding protein involved in chromosome partitioning
MLPDIEKIRKILSEIIHPEKGKSITELGMLENLSVKDGKIELSLLFERANDPFLGKIKRESEEKITEFIGEGFEVLVSTKLKKEEPKPELEKPLKDVKNILAVASGKGGVGKSTVAVNLAIALARGGYRVGVIDADIFGPSIPKMFGLENEKPSGVKIDGKDYILPIEKFGVKVLSIGFFVDPNNALVWRGPMASGALKQLLLDTHWGEIDYLLVDLPPGTSDIHLTLVQTVAVTGAIVVSTPQDVALADARKGVAMFATQGIEVPVLGLVENMAWFTPEELPDNKYYIFGEGGCIKLANELNLPLLGQIPLVQSVREAGDYGNPAAVFKTKVTLEAFEDLSNNVIKQVNNRNKNLDPTKIVNITHK